ncbi:sirohydrochlorin cobaltochelatase [Paraclostridium sordellii]|uniref:sirohydrochlorin cobaltochelatase n=1 Tax=Paraclostridium sordellii TaxID=1505 RepID=UPI0005DC2280|nr:sirohydrochlorin cobaltochelatase [Paeniclostridium sordellii]CEO10889.1 Sirohydrochlorin cobaltochelatase [[Clostridium] sordellii] [Paeniclostridium sordellii]CEP87722.1 Sirohydrochlorin cobaltochelatase [[Clostridium] sordellii] [Paeniclostridium sordellii]CEP96191.1 Sirohydrochlorin cobaltochelatase [[Clostridium] sordellii] [Paeniclostridium sordellii]CEQ00393.1 Sirohydrochlorin cobaltochelatase [[Clostridium] sordellii] [Paeniclostridium sordellii]
MKKAILVISFGTSYNETRKKTIEACEKKIKDAFEDYDFFRAFTSNMIIRKLKKRDNVDIENPIQALDRLYEEGYKEVIVQTLHIICGEEYTKLREQISQYEDKFEKITLGRPLLTQIEDYKETVEALKLQIPELEEDEAVVFMGHGTEHEAHSAYPALDYMLKQEDLKAYVGTVEGYPEVEEVIVNLRKDRISKVRLMPFMLVAGDHAINDMASDEEDSWKSILNKEGFETKIHLQGLGENEGIQDKFVRHAQDCVKVLSGGEN